MSRFFFQPGQNDTIGSDLAEAKLPVADRARSRKEPTPQQLTALRNALGGCSTLCGTPEHAIAEDLLARGWMQELALTDRGTRWQLTAAGLDLAYPNRVPNPPKSWRK